MTVTRVLKTYPKDPEAVLEYGFDWAPWLAQADLTLSPPVSAEIITASTWALPADLTSPAVGLTKDSDSHNGTATTIWLSGGVDGEDYIITNHVHTNAGRHDDRSLKIKVRSR